MDDIFSKELTEMTTELKATLMKLVGNAEMSDIDIRIRLPDGSTSDDLTIPGHSAILACRCQNLGEMIAIERATTAAGERMHMEFFATSKEDFLCVLRYLYAADLSSITGENSSRVREIAQNLELAPLEAACSKIQSTYLKDRLDMTKAADTLENIGKGESKSKDDIENLARVIAQIVEYYGELDENGRTDLLESVRAEFMSHSAEGGEKGKEEVSEEEEDSSAAGVDKNEQKRLMRGIAHLDKPTLLDVLQDNALAIDELELFRFVRDWIRAQMSWKAEREISDEELAEELVPYMERIRFPCMLMEELATVVQTSGLVSEDLVLEAYESIAMEKVGGEDMAKSGALTIPQLRLIPRFSRTLFMLDPARKGPNINITNAGLTAVKVGSSYETVLADRGWTRGRHYWEVTIDHYSRAEDIFIGVGHLPYDTTVQSAPVGTNFWSFLCSYGKKVHESRMPYSSALTDAGSILGVYLDIDHHKLGFFRNGEWCGWAFTDLPTGHEWYAGVNLYYPDSQVSFSFPRKVPHVPDES